MFSDGAAFHTSVKVNCRNVLIWGEQNLHQMIEHVQESYKINVCVL